ncbi:MAG: hypothetical protein LBT59_17590 [Clostridiales bacterium]|jgi:hypothetical protein|nr:hypothetical protein [Clostridiales bacterium]
MKKLVVFLIALAIFLGGFASAMFAQNRLLAQELEVAARETAKPEEAGTEPTEAEPSAIDPPATNPAMTEEPVLETEAPETGAPNLAETKAPETETPNPVETEKPGITIYGLGDSYQGAEDGDWPSNEYTKIIPKPSFPVDIEGGGMDDEDFTIVFRGASIDEIKAYAEEIKEAGFVLDPETDEFQVGSFDFYNYEAKNEAGYEVEVFSARGIAGLSIEKPRSGNRRRD